MDAAHTLLDTAPVKDQNITELRPMICDNGKKKNLPAAIPAEPAEFYGKISVLHILVK